jgi:type I restriction enzyme S subunit
MKAILEKHNISNEWSSLPVSNVFIFVKSYAFSRDSLINDTSNNEGIGNIHYGDIHAKFSTPSIDLRDISVPMIRSSNFTPDPEDYLKDGDLIMADASEDYEGVGVTVSVHGIGNKKIVGGLHTFVLRDDKKKTDDYYRQYIFRNPKVRNSLQKIANGVSVYGISKSAVSKLLLPIPPLVEQSRIVAVLETWDKAIEELTKKIEIKKEIKKGLMQELLTGKKRLQGFSEKWQNRTLSDLGNFSKGTGILKDQVSEKGFNAVRYGELYTVYSYQINKVFSHIPASITTEAREIKYGDILFAGSGETNDEIGKSAAYLLHEKCYAGGDIIVFSPNGCDSLFLSYFLNVGESRKLLRELGQGQSVVHLYKSDLETMELRIPSYTEQKAIATVLYTAETEISIFERKLSYFKDQKKYLLNNLITGTIRTPEKMKITKLPC